MRVFIVRPFGVKEGIDFDAVERELIQPALQRLNRFGIQVTGGTTGEITRAGNIREDMFRLLVVSDLVIADVSIHNANVFYELGLRHALRARHTFVIRRRTEYAYPFDLQTDRYLLYDGANPGGLQGATIDELATALRSTLAFPGPSSPVFNLLPDLKEHERTQLVRVPRDFAEDVERARRAGQRGDLRLYSHEVRSFEWDQEALRLIGEAQFKLRANAGARDTFELLRAAAPDDLRANQRLGTIYQRLAFAESAERRQELLARSDQAIQRALKAAAAPGDRAEALALLGSNVKSRWIADFRATPPERRQSAALRSPHLSTMIGLYLEAASADLNAHYPAVNALALLNAQIALARLQPDDWALSYENEAKAAADLTARELLASRLTASLTLILGLDEVLGKRSGALDPWAESSRADLLLFTSPNRPERIAQAYRQALTGVDLFTLEATRRNLAVFQDLGLFEPNLSAALREIDGAIAAAQPQPTPPDRVILFTGHMVDAPDCPKEKQRFPRTQKAEAIARGLIKDAVQAELQVPKETTLGIAGGACGGDILFHEVCGELGVATELFLALPKERFSVTSVQRGGADWVERYRKLCDRLPPRVLQDSEALPNWLVDKPDYDVWQRNNLWMIFNALAKGARRTTLIALYNADKDPAGPGGTKHLLEEARDWDFKSVELDARRLLE